MLWQKLMKALPPGATSRTEYPEVKPAVVDIPAMGPVRIYLSTLTKDQSQSGRPKGEFKIQPIPSGQPRGKRAGLDLGGMPTALLGYSPDFGVFVGWEARLYYDFAYSRNVQVREDLLSTARDHGWAVAP